VTKCPPVVHGMYCYRLPACRPGGRQDVTRLQTNAKTLSLTRSLTRLLFLASVTLALSHTYTASLVNRQTTLERNMSHRIAICPLFSKTTFSVVPFCCNLSHTNARNTTGCSFRALNTHSSDADLEMDCPWNREHFSA